MTSRSRTGIRSRTRPVRRRRSDRNAWPPLLRRLRPRRKRRQRRPRTWVERLLSGIHHPTTMGVTTTAAVLAWYGTDRPGIGVWACTAFAVISLWPVLQRWLRR